MTLNYTKISKIDYLAHFGQLWIGFNKWYNINSTQPQEWARILDSSNGSSMLNVFNKAMDSLSNIDPYITREVDNLSTCICHDRAGERTTYSLDTTGFKFRLLCTNTNDFVAFIQACSRINILKERCTGILFFKPTQSTDPLFKKIYYKYSNHMATSEQGANPYNTLDISQLLENANIIHKGQLVFNDLTTSSVSALYDIRSVYGASYEALCSELSSIDSVKRAKNAGVEMQYRMKEKNLFERYLLILYAFRSAYFHGDFNPYDKDIQKAAKFALSSLSELISECT